MFFDKVQVENQKMSSVSFVQILNQFMFKKIIDAVKKLKKMKIRI